MAGQSILDALDEALRTGDGVDEIVSAFYGLAQSANDATRTKMLASLDARLHDRPIERIANVAMLAGALVEFGADVRAFPPAAFDHLVAQLDTIRGPDDETELPEAYYLVERAAMACLSRSAELRRTLPQKPAILARLRRYPEHYGFLGRMLHVLDDEPLIVVQPAKQRGFRFVMSGIADNFQLHTLLLGALAETIGGHVPSCAAVAASTDGATPNGVQVQSDWQLANWFALRPDGEIDRGDYVRTWIWNEGVPADIAAFEGTRVVLIGTSTIQRSWKAQRVFDGMIGKLERLARIPDADVLALLRRMETTARA